MTSYFRPIPCTDAARPARAHMLAGGWAWFSHAQALSRDAAPDLVTVADIPPETLENLTRPRAPIAGLTLDTPRLMGILNVTPDSFSDGGRFAAPGTALDHAMAMAADGADILDIGGESTRPGAGVVAVDTEIARTVPIIAALAPEMATPISIDTRKAPVARAALDAGAQMFNDITALRFDPDLTALAATRNVPVILMHSGGEPEDMQVNPQYDNVLLDVFDHLAARVMFAEAAGIRRENIIIDPGIGFGKTLEHNLVLLRNLGLFHGLGCPILLGASRKRFIGTIGDATEPQARMPGSIAVALAAVAQGVQILRVHDIRETRQALSLHKAVTGKGA